MNSSITDQLDAKLVDLESLLALDSANDPTVLRQAKECAGEIRSLCEELPVDSEIFRKSFAVFSSFRRFLQVIVCDAFMWHFVLL